MKKSLLAFIGMVFILAACGGETTTPAPERLQPSDITLPDTYDEERAQAAYKKSCAACHGVNLQGGGAYPYPITGISKEEMYIAIVQGVGVMPANLVTGEDAENLAVWIAAQ
ncbi:c-type cytochrome [Anaerobacillus isosaccharinicus]|uniref:Cytochrome c n=1 Tax=Anaerobacillus isosaccharinicus TaxID=1532552 RepID=A0A1S2MES2_9BACI|nr:cytochrome c [Anaerobacillus isosaccharinicus]MBA5584642.1 cytochrome c [Anaerobacillus isosaccharinicus]QOY36984.1 cytochrome c [Anaerobacillus isosaccharinicus]